MRLFSIGFLVGVITVPFAHAFVVAAFVTMFGTGGLA